MLFYICSPLSFWLNGDPHFDGMMEPMLFGNVCFLRDLPHMKDLAYDIAVDVKPVIRRKSQHAFDTHLPRGFCAVLPTDLGT